LYKTGSKSEKKAVDLGQRKRIALVVTFAIIDQVYKCLGLLYSLEIE
jgi:hypothetical protein